MKKYWRIGFLAMCFFLGSIISALAYQPLEEVAWMGKSEDKVGTWGNFHPDGTLDGHFRLTLCFLDQAEIASMAVYSADAAGNPSGGQVWHSKNSSYWMTGVFYNGMLLNNGYRESLGKFQGRNTFDLYCNDSGYFNEGQNFLVEVVFSNGSSLRQTVKVSSAPVFNGGGITDFIWLGKNVDKVGEWDNGRPDGKLDGHFRITLNIPGQAEIKSIAVYSADANGNPAGGQIWHSREGRYWVLGVEYQGRQLNYNHATTLGMFKGGLVTMDLYCNDSGWFNAGQHFLVEIEFSAGQKIRSFMRL